MQVFRSYELYKQYTEANALAVLQDLVRDWRSQLALNCPEQSAANRESIILWLIGNDLERFAQFDLNELAMTRQQMASRYRTLQQRYLGASPEQAYRNLVTRLGCLVLLRHEARACVALCRNYRWLTVDVLEQVLQELLTCDLYMQHQIVWIAECSGDTELRNALLFASLEEYCSRPIRQRPLIFYQFLNHLRQIQQQG